MNDELDNAGYNSLVNVVKHHGWDGLISSLSKKYKNKYYCVSQAWLEHPSEYILKAKGVYGDLIISFNMEGLKA